MRFSTSELKFSSQRIEIGRIGVHNCRLASASAVRPVGNFEFHRTGAMPHSATPSGSRTAS